MENSKIYELNGSKWKIPENVNIIDRSGSNYNGYFEINIDGNIYTVDAGSIVNVLSLIENHL